MTNKLTLNNEIETFFETEDKQIWDLIIEDKINDLLALLPREDAENDTLDEVVKELFSCGESETLRGYDFITLKEGNGAFIRNLVRLIFALDINGNHEELKAKVLDRLLHSFPEIAEKIQKETFGYPARVVDNYILSESATVRAALISLIFYYSKEEDADALHFVTVLRTQITLAIMRNYKNVVGHDMIETARVKERIGEREAALTFYNGALDNLKNELQWFIETSEVGPSEEDVVMLQSLKEAYQSIDRLNNTAEHTKVCNLIDEVLSREYVEFDFDEDDDDEE
jgi:hypothetical protein